MVNTGYRFYFLIFFLQLIISEVYAEEILFKHIGTKEGLSQSSVSAIVPDNLGRLWVGTRDGINLYDGIKFRTFRPLRGDSGSLLEHFITDIVYDNELFWIITKSGVSKFSIQNQQFENFQIADAYCVLNYNGEVLLGTNAGLYVLDEKINNFVKSLNYLNRECIIQSMYVDVKGNLFFCTNEGLYVYDEEQKHTNKVLAINSTKIFIDSKDRTWVGTYNNGVYLLDESYNVLEHFNSSNNFDYSLVSNIIRDIEEDSEGNIWIGTFLGLNIIYPDDNFKIVEHTHDESEPGTLSNNSILCITRDHQGGMWLGTYHGGINYYHPNFNNFKRFSIRTDNMSANESLGYNVIGEIIEDDFNNIWIATEGGGVDKYNPISKTIDHYRLKEGNDEQDQFDMNVKSLLFLDNENLLIGTHLSGLKKLNVKSGKFRSFLPDPSDSTSIQSNIVEEIIFYKNNFYLLGTKEGVILYDRDNQSFSNFIADENGIPFRKRVNCLLIDRFGILWIGTMNDGLYSFNPENKKLKQYSSSSTELTTISSNNISYIYEDHFYRIWFGTHGGGLNLYVRETDSFEYFNVGNSNISSNFIQGIEKSRLGNLWISTSKGLSLFDYKNKYFYNISNENDLPLEEPNHRAIYMTSKGVLYVGGINGLVSFREEDVLNNDYNFKLFFSAIEVNGKLISPNDSTSILSKDIAYTDSIKLNPNQQLFTIHFSTTDYISGRNFKYRYKFEGDMNEWMKIHNQNTITFSKLPSGNHTLRVQAVSNDTGDIIDEANLHLKVMAPIYQRWYAIMFYITLAGSIIWFLNRSYRERIRVLEKLEAEKREKEQIEKLNQTKLNFFTNVSHEFKTPLTIIAGLLESILGSTRDKKFIIKKVGKSLDNVYRLNYLVNELLDFRRLDNGSINIELTEYSFNKLIQSVFDLFSETASDMEIQYQLYFSSDNIHFSFDYYQIEKVFYNLISNAFKAVEEGTGKIEVEVFLYQNRVITKVRDNGIGINDKYSDKIFNRYYHEVNTYGNRYNNNSGIGLSMSKEIVELHGGTIKVDSEENIYTIFTVELPLKKNEIGLPEVNLVENKKNISVQSFDAIKFLPEIQSKSKTEVINQSNSKGHKLLLIEDN